MNTWFLTLIVALACVAKVTGQTTDASDDTTAEASDDSCGQAFEKVTLVTGNQDNDTFSGIGGKARVSFRFKQSVPFTIDSLSVTPINSVTKLIVIGIPESGDKLRAVFDSPIEGASITETEVVTTVPEFDYTALKKLVILAKGKEGEPTFVVDSATACKG